MPIKNKDEYIEELEAFIFDLCEEIDDFVDLAETCLCSDSRLREMEQTLKKVKIEYIYKHGGKTNG
jgi:hypothetical protein